MGRREDRLKWASDFGASLSRWKKRKRGPLSDLQEVTKVGHPYPNLDKGAPPYSAARDLGERSPILSTA